MTTFDKTPPWNWLDQQEIIEHFHPDATDYEVWQYIFKHYDSESDAEEIARKFGAWVEGYRKQPKKIEVRIVIAEI